MFFSLFFFFFRVQTLPLQYFHVSYILYWSCTLNECTCRFCVCYIHLEFQKLLQVLDQYFSVVHAVPCDCRCEFCANGQCNPQQTTDLFKIHWFMKHLLCEPKVVFLAQGGKYSYYKWECVTLQCNLCYKAKKNNLLLCPKAKLWATEEDPDSGLTWEEYKRTDINIISAKSYKGPTVKLAAAPKKQQIFNLFQEVSGSNRQFMQTFLNKMPFVFKHHQLERVQREVKNLKIPMLRKGITY